MLILDTEVRTYTIDVTYAGSVISVEVNPLSLEELDRLRRKHTKIRKGNDDADNVKMYYDIVDKTVLSWTGVHNKDKTPMECNKENKIRLISNPITAKFIDAIMDEVNDLSESLQDKKKGSETT